MAVDAERVAPCAILRRLRTRGAFAVSDALILFVIALSELAVVDGVVEAVTERDASDAVAGFAVDTFVEPVTSEATTDLLMSLLNLMALNLQHLLKLALPNLLLHLVQLML